MSVTFVTAFYAIPNKYRALETYLQNLEKLIQTGVPILCYLDASLKEQGKALLKKYKNFKIPQYVTLDMSWIPENVILPTIRNEEKDTKEYLAVQLQKTWCLAEASKYVFTSHIAWIDAGIVHIFKEEASMKLYLEKIRNSNWPGEIICPGCMWLEAVAELYGEGKPYTMMTAICWRYLGGFLLGPTDAWPAFYENQTKCVKEHLPHLVWEVNYWAMLEQFKWYQADHNICMFENLMEFALPSA